MKKKERCLFHFHPNVTTQLIPDEVLPIMQQTGKPSFHMKVKTIQVLKDNYLCIYYLNDRGNLIKDDNNICFCTKIKYLEDSVNVPVPQNNDSNIINPFVIPVIEDPFSLSTQDDLNKETNNIGNAESNLIGSFNIPVIGGSFNNNECPLFLF